MQLASEDVDERRRDAVRLRVNLRFQGRVAASPVEGTLLNISKSGCLLESADVDRIAHGTTIVFPLLIAEQVSGQVVWCYGGRFGIKFYETLSDDVLSRVQQEDTEQKRYDAMIFLDGFGRQLPDLATLRSNPRVR